MIIIVCFKVSVIENAVAQNFLNAFSSAIVTMANNVANSLFNNIPTTLYFPQYHLDISLKGGFDTFPLGALNGNLVLYAVGNITHTHTHNTRSYYCTALSFFPQYNNVQFLFHMSKFNKHFVILLL
jgi:hypothetical protein